MKCYQRISMVVLGCILSLGLLACTNTNSIVDGPTATPTIDNGDPVITPNLQDESRLPVLAGTPIPIPEVPITAENVSELQELAIWGKGEVMDLAYSPDGQLLAIGTTAGIWLHDADTFEVLSFLRTDGWVSALAFTPQRTLVADVQSGVLEEWDVHTGERLRAERIYDFYQTNKFGGRPPVQFSAQPTTFAARLNNDNVQVWNISNWTQQRAQTPIVLQTLNAGRFALSPPLLNQHTLLAHTANAAIDIWDTVNNTKLHSLPTNASAMAFSQPLSPTNQNLLLASGTTVDYGQDLATIKIWDLSTGALQHSLRGQRAVLEILKFSPDSGCRRLAATWWWQQGNEPIATIQIWDLDNGWTASKLTGHMGRIKTVAFAPFGCRLAVSDWGGRVQIWNLTTQKTTATIDGFWPAIHDIDLDDRYLFFTPKFDGGSPANIDPDRRAIQQWDIASAQQLNQIGPYDGDARFGLSADGQALVAKSWIEIPVQVWDVSTLQQMHTLQTDNYLYEIVAITPDSTKTALSSYRSSVILIYDNATGAQLFRLRGSGEPFSISPDSAYLASILVDDSQLRLWNLDTGKLLQTSASLGLPLDPKGVAAGPPVFSPDGQRVVIGDINNRIWQWTLDSNVVDILTVTPNQANHLAFTPDGHLLVSGRGEVVPTLPRGWPDATVHFWAADTGQLIGALATYTANISELALTRDGTMLVTSSTDGTVRFWGIPSE